MSLLGDALKRELGPKLSELPMYETESGLDVDLELLAKEVVSDEEIYRVIAECYRGPGYQLVAIGLFRRLYRDGKIAAHINLTNCSDSPTRGGTRRILLTIHSYSLPD